MTEQELIDMAETFVQKVEDVEFSEHADYMVTLAQIAIAKALARIADVLEVGTINVEAKVREP